MLGWLSKLALFFSSYIPLYVIFGAAYYKQPLILGGSVGITLGSFVGMIACLSFLRHQRDTEKFEVARISRRDEAVLGYLVGYLMPFLAAFSGTEEAYIASLLFFLFLAIYYASTDMLCINPTLRMAGLSFYEVETDEGQVVSLLGKEDLRRGDYLTAVAMGSGGSYFELRRKHRITNENNKHEAALSAAIDEHNKA